MKSYSAAELIQSLQSILDAQSPHRTELVKEFQDLVWNDESIQDEKLNEVISELAYDLDFYEPNEIWRKETPNYYGDDKLEEVIALAIRKLKG